MASEQFCFYVFRLLCSAIHKIPSYGIMMRNCEDNIYHAYLCLLQDMQEMKNCYDSLLSAAAATANSAYGKLFTTFYESYLLCHCVAYGHVLCFFSDKNQHVLW
jgi:hypothetical protein